MRKFLVSLSFMLISTSISTAQFDIEAYKEYLKTHRNMSATQLMNEYPAGVFYEDAPTDFHKSQYADSVKLAFNLTNHEIDLISRHGFMVTERKQYPTFINAYWDIYNKDLPVYVSADAILHALHFSFSLILADIESRYISVQLDSALSLMKAELANQVRNNPPELFDLALNDVDVFLTVAKKLLGFNENCIFPINEDEVAKIIKFVNSEKKVTEKIFSSSHREFDFSQLKPRGHYTRSYELKKYFQSMMWLGRTEFLFTNPENIVLYKQTDEDLQRMTIASALMAEITHTSNAIRHFENIERILKFLIGTQDNISLFDAIETMKKQNIVAFDLCDVSKYKDFVEEIRTHTGANQLYNSQILYSSLDGESVVQPISFLLLGQRPVIDGFITANVVFDRVFFNNVKVTRMIPSTLDILFALGNDASAQLLDEELEKHPYASNLAALRYLINGYDNDFWRSSVYTNWLSAIRTLNPPLKRKALPRFMQTAAWWQKTMTTQLASWAELRHDFLLYTKQPYTYGNICEFPFGFVEAVPEFFERISIFFQDFKEIVKTDKKIVGSDTTFFNNWIETSSKLKTLAEKSLANIEYSDEENKFINSMISYSNPCSMYQGELGWYQKLYLGFSHACMYDYLFSPEVKEADKPVVVDVHTIPTDEYANPVGWVLHAGTGNINICVITTEKPDGGTRTYTGAVSSYYEYLSNNYQRLTNEEWREMEMTPSMKPAFANLYMADETGKLPSASSKSLYTIQSSVNEFHKPKANDLQITCYPNPAKNYLFINFKVTNSDESTNISIYDLKGNMLNTIVSSTLESHNYVFKWDLADASGNRLPAGTYIISIKSGSKLHSTKVVIGR